MFKRQSWSQKSVFCVKIHPVATQGCFSLLQNLLLLELPCPPTIICSCHASCCPSGLPLCIYFFFCLWCSHRSPFWVFCFFFVFLHCVSVSGVTSVVLPYGRWHHAVLPQGRTTDGMLGGVCVRQPVRQSITPSAPHAPRGCGRGLRSAAAAAGGGAFILSNIHSVHSLSNLLFRFFCSVVRWNCFKTNFNTFDLILIISWCIFKAFTALFFFKCRF